MWKRRGYRGGKGGPPSPPHLVPIAYNAYRLIALKRWVLIAFATLPPSTVTFSHYYRNRHLLYHVILSSTLLTYWSLNLFAFLIPIASMRYIRSYLYCVKAEEVVLREGDDAFAGLLPSLIWPFCPLLPYRDPYHTSFSSPYQNHNYVYGVPIMSLKIEIQNSRICIGRAIKLREILISKLLIK